MKGFSKFFGYYKDVVLVDDLLITTDRKKLSLQS